MYAILGLGEGLIIPVLLHQAGLREGDAGRVLSTGAAMMGAGTLGALVGWRAWAVWVRGKGFGELERVKSA